MWYKCPWITADQHTQVQTNWKWWRWGWETAQHTLIRDERHRNRNIRWFQDDFCYIPQSSSTFSLFFAKSNADRKFITTSFWSKQSNMRLDKNSLYTHWWRSKFMVWSAVFLWSSLSSCVLWSKSINAYALSIQVTQLWGLNKEHKIKEIGNRSDKVRMTKLLSTVEKCAIRCFFFSFFFGNLFESF